MVNIEFVAVRVQVVDFLEFLDAVREWVNDGRTYPIVNERFVNNFSVVELEVDPEFLKDYKAVLSA